MANGVGGGGVVVMVGPGPPHTHPHPSSYLSVCLFLSSPGDSNSWDAIRGLPRGRGRCGAQAALRGGEKKKRFQALHPLWLAWEDPDHSFTPNKSEG